ncbi:hypothetical protein RFI_10734 [Reticulomyxa filosa]|uniref:Uncharacterized protein n=1 Tax=Reticulomyxa filosa TaxID=46433 RepID=X6NL34_RETFI|nr:hypothetical protein RFI_10734 [Reticulomyxa filosa]|eukprot:ETO26404.1 hypothetical protein RFI_10734 [Reticulomyxa filosa]
MGSIKKNELPVRFFKTCQDCIDNFVHFDDQSGYGELFYCRVICGESIQSNDFDAKPPQKKNSNETHETVVENKSNPTIFVTFDAHQSIVIFKSYLSFCSCIKKKCLIFISFCLFNCKRIDISAMILFDCIIPLCLHIRCVMQNIVQMDTFKYLHLLHKNRHLKVFKNDDSKKFL